jgi:hypothetical protein
MKLVLIRIRNTNSHLYSVLFFLLNFFDKHVPDLSFEFSYRMFFLSLLIIVGLCRFHRFLSTLERHFKNVTHGATFRVVTETLSKMMSALRMVWIISRHYNRDERMVPLMERIGNQLCERVARSINVRTLFRYRTNLYV